MSPARTDGIYPAASVCTVSRRACIVEDAPLCVREAAQTCPLPSLTARRNPPAAPSAAAPGTVPPNSLWLLPAKSPPAVERKPAGTPAPERPPQPGQPASPISTSLTACESESVPPVCPSRVRCKSLKTRNQNHCDHFVGVRSQR